METLCNISNHWKHDTIYLINGNTIQYIQGVTEIQVQN